jgi:hypothetical protein
MDLGLIAPVARSSSRRDSSSLAHFFAWVSLGNVAHFVCPALRTKARTRVLPLLSVLVWNDAMRITYVSLEMGFSVILREEK